MKKSKRFLSLLVGMAMLFSMFAGTVSVSANDILVFDPDYDHVKDGYTVQPGAETLVETLPEYDGHNNVVHFKPCNGNVTISTSIFSESLNSGKYKVSFDFKSNTDAISSTSGSLATIKLGANTRTSLSAAEDYFTWPVKWSFGTDASGFMRCFYVNGETNDGTYGINSNYQNGVWYHIDCVYNYAEGKVQVYCDGKNFSNRPIFTGEYESARAFSIMVMQQNRAQGDVYFSNIKVNALGNQTITAEYDAANSTDSSIAVKFSEAISQENLSELKIIDSETLEEVSTASATVNGLTAAIPVSNLKYGAEYRISVPAGIKGAFDGTTTAQEICFNTADITGSFGNPTFEDDFDDYTSVGNAGYADVVEEGKTSIGDVWTKIGGGWDGSGRYANNKALRIDFWQVDNNAASARAIHDFAAPYTSGRIEYNFDLAIGNLEETDPRVFSFVLKRSSKNQYDPVFDIQNNVITLHNKISNSTNPQEVTSFTMPGNLSEMVSFKVVEDLTAHTIKTYVKQNGEYVLLNDSPDGAGIDTTYHGSTASSFGFQFYKGTTTDFPKTTGSAIIDNVKVYVGEPPMSPVVKKVRLDGTTLTSANASAATAGAKIYFNQDMDSDTLRNITVTSDGGETVGANIAYDSSDYSCTLQFTDTLSAETKYTINVPASVKTTDGRALAREYNGVFTTGEGVMYISDPEISRDGDVVTAKVTGVNQTGASGKYMLILACYDGNKLISVKYDPKSYTASDKTLNSELTYTVPSTATSFSAQAMLWDGFEKMIPIKPAADLQLQ